MTSFRRAFDTAPGARLWLVAVFLLVNGAVLWNAVFHDPRMGYDARHHLAYVRVLADFRLPTPDESHAFYSPPLPYLVPAAALRFAGQSLIAAAKIGQLVQFLASVVLTLALLLVCERLRPGDGVLKIGALGLCGMAAVYYRSFSFLRGEPYVACLGMLAVPLALTALDRERFELRRALILGVVCGGIALGRQMGFLLLVGLGAFSVIVVLRKPRLLASVLATTAVVGAIAFLIAGWFYLHLRWHYGASTVWNLKPLPFSFANQPLSFYFGTGDGQLFRAPGRPTFQDQMGPVLYSDWWGDFWSYFLFRGRWPNGNCANGAPLSPAFVGPHPGISNHASMIAYLARVNRAALVPSVLLLMGLGVGAGALIRFIRGGDMRSGGLALVFLLVASTMAGFLWLVIAFPRPGDGDTVKATYIVQVVPLVAILGAEALARLSARSRLLFLATCVLLISVAAHNAGAAFTRWGMPVDCLFPQ